ncbi:hypothetical protein KGQ19_22395 [Catenulispora sp. NL8]|uniref:Uncharacterized protein n=1 Tax=Catenulispora pinistramenti TaxID=2705254 RepID=A0ABS5KUA6_9ACTN|nr:hypothetical protein [Catenulispora pinistramenti]MBS2549618.1 hypothetical protein [Catenulispora pinistramenti]
MGSIPGVPESDLEDRLARWAQLCSAPVPPPGRRFYSITYLHNGTLWTATVGETLRGTKTKTRRSATAPVAVSTPVSDPATVLAILPGDPLFHVVTDAGPTVKFISAWENPYMVGIHDIQGSTRFDTA